MSELIDRVKDFYGELLSDPAAACNEFLAERSTECVSYTG